MAEMTKKTTAAAKTTKSATKAAKPAVSGAKAIAKKAPAVAVAKKPVAKAAAKKPAAKAKAPAAKKVAAPVVVTAPKPAMRVSDEQRYRMVAEAAYYRAESNHFKSDPVRDWIEAESDITTLLSGGN